MQYPSTTAPRLGRHRHLALAMGLALGLAGTSALAAADQTVIPTQSGISTHRMRTRGAVTGHLGRPGLSVPTRTTGSSTSHTAATISVTSCDDAGSGHSLRDAINIANDGDTIDLSGLPDCTINLNSSLVTTVDNLTIKGKSGSKYPIISGQDNYTQFVHFGTGTLTLQGVSLYHGKFVSNSTSSLPGGCVLSAGNVKLIDSRAKYCSIENTAGGAAIGGAIYSKGDTILDNSRVVLNRALNSGSGNAQGGGIYSLGTTTLKNGSVVAQNTAEAQGTGTARGGGIFAAGPITSQGASIVTYNLAQAAGGSALGGGIFAVNGAGFLGTELSDNSAKSTDGQAAAGALMVSNGSLSTKYSTISDNQAQSSNSFSVAGGIVAYGDVSLFNTTISGNLAQRAAGAAFTGATASAPIDIVSSTVSGNVASNSLWGAGLYLAHDATLRNSTITGNIESNVTDNKYGAGISLKHGVHLDLSSTIVSANLLKKADNTTLPSDIDPANGNSSGTSVTGDYDLIGFTTVTYPGSHTLQSFDPGLWPLRFNGGLTKTHALKAQSAAVDAGTTNGESSDQRGSGFDRIVGAAADIGAFELGNDIIFIDGFE